jgi:hypothetical protein
MNGPPIKSQINTEQLKSCGTLTDAVGDQSGARTIVDIDYLIAFDKQIGNPPDDRLLVEIANLDLDELERGLILRRDIIRIESELKCCRISVLKNQKRLL